MKIYEIARPAGLAVAHRKRLPEPGSRKLKPTATSKIAKFIKFYKSWRSSSGVYLSFRLSEGKTTLRPFVILRQTVSSPLNLSGASQWIQLAPARDRSRFALVGNPL